MEAKVKGKNEHDTREGWYRGGTDRLRPDFEKRNLKIPDKVRLAQAFTSRGIKTKRRGDCLTPEASADGHYEIIIGNDLDDPVECLSILTLQLLHAVTGPGLGPKYRDAAISLGFDVRNGLRKAQPGPILLERLQAIATELGPLPHAKVDWAKVMGPGGKPRKQSTRMLKSLCRALDTAGTECGYTVRLAAAWVKIGAPHCPLHGSMEVIRNPEEGEPMEEAA